MSLNVEQSQNATAGEAMSGPDGISLNVEEAISDSLTMSSLSRVLRLMYRAIEEGPLAIQDFRSSRSTSRGLEEILYDLWDELAPTGVQFRILVEGQPKALNPAVQEQIYLIAREALVNALQHSGAEAIEAVVEYSPRRLRVVVRDNGCGVDPQAVQPSGDSHLGLPEMRERAASVGAQLRLLSKVGAGTEVEISVPIRVVAAVHAQLSTAIA